MQRPRKALGQHFLTDIRILDRIVAALDPTPDEVVLEIGPGFGALTARLLAVGLRVVAIEKDRALARDCGLRNAECGIERLRIVQGDALRMDWHTFIDTPPAIPHSAFRISHLADSAFDIPRSDRSAIRKPQFKVVGNIPYNITSPLIDKALRPPWPERIVFLVQSEVAARLGARPGTAAYGALSVGVQAVCRVERLFAVKAGAFHPRPRVDSTVVRLTPRPDPLVPPEALAAFRSFVTACFARRRKQLRNVLAGVWDRDPAAVAATLGALAIDPAARPETLAPARFATLLPYGSRL